MSKVVIRLALSVATVLAFASAGAGQGQVVAGPPMPQPGVAAMRLQQEAFQVAARNAQRLQLLEQFRLASPLTYYDSDWRPSTAKLADGREVKAPMRYNLVTQALEIQRASTLGLSDSVLVLPQFLAVQLGTAVPAMYRDFIIETYESATSQRDHNLFERITQTAGPVQLLLLHEVILESTAPAFAPGGTGRPAEQTVQRVSRLYARLPNRSRIREVSLSKRAILHLFGNDSGRMSEYAVAHQLSFTDLAQVVQLVDEYNKTVRP